VDDLKIKAQWRIPVASKKRFEQRAKGVGRDPGQVLNALMNRYGERSGWRLAWMTGEISDAEALVLLWNELGEPPAKRRRPPPPPKE
jgi:hypothetical protein